MLRNISPKAGLISLALAALVVGIAYAVEIQRSLSGSVIVGKVETAEDTILLYSSIDPSTVPLTELNYGTVDVTAFGLFKQRPILPLFVGNGGDVPFSLRVDVSNVKVNGSPVAGALALDLRPVPLAQPAAGLQASSSYGPSPTSTAVPAPTPTPALAPARFTASSLEVTPIAVQPGDPVQGHRGRYQP